MDINPLTSKVAVAAPSTTATPLELTPERTEMIQAIQAINRAELLGADRELTFVLDRQSRAPLLRIVDRETGEVIRQIPPEHVLRLARELRAGNSSGILG